MPCKYADLISTPKIQEVTEVKKSYFIERLGKLGHYFEQNLIPTYEVCYEVDFGICCGYDFVTVEYPTREAAQADINRIFANKHDWIRYHPDRISEDE